MGIHAYTHAQWSTNRGCFLEIIVLVVSRCIFFEGGEVGIGNTCGICKTIAITAAKMNALKCRTLSAISSCHCGMEA